MYVLGYHMKIFLVPVASINDLPFPRIISLPPLLFPLSFQIRIVIVVGTRTKGTELKNNIRNSARTFNYFCQKVFEQCKLSRDPYSKLEIKLKTQKTIRKQKHEGKSTKKVNRPGLFEKIGIIFI